MVATVEAQPQPLYEAVVNSVPEAIVVASPDGEIVFFNRAAERLFGYAAADVLGRSIAMLVPPQAGRRADPVKWLNRWAAEPQPEQARYLDFEARRQNGERMPVDVRVSEGEVGGQRRFFLTLRDNTARRQEQAALKETNLRAARILLMAEDAIVSCDAAQVITFYNLAAERMFGHLMEDALGQPLSMLLPLGLRTGHAALVDGFATDPTPSKMMSERREVRGLRRSGEEFPIEAGITKVALGGDLTYTAHLRDVSRRRATQRRLEESERRLRTIFDHAVAAVALLGPDGVVLEVNAAGRALTEGSGELVGRPLWELPWLGGPPAGDPGRQRLKSSIEMAAAGVAVRYTAELGQGADARRLDLTLTPIRDASGAVIYILPEARELDPRSTPRI